MAVRAPELHSVEWLNSEPLELRKLHGKVILLDFFTYCCVNCLNNLRTIKRIRQRFGEELQIIGVHSAKFDREKEPDALQNALDRLGITYPVINDASHSLFDSYAVKAWPTIVIIDPNGYIVQTFSGENQLDELERTLAGLGIFPMEEERTTQPADAAKLNFPQKIRCEEEFLLVANTGADSVWLCDYDGKILEIFHKLSEPMGMVIYKEKLYVANRGKNEIIEIDLKNKKRRIVLKGLRAPYDMEIVDDSLFVAMAASHQIIVYALDDFTKLATYGNKFEALRDGSLEEAQLAQPSGLTRLYDQLWFVDAESSSLRVIQNDNVHTAIGDGLFTFGDEDGGEILLQHPQGVVAGQYGDGCGGGRIFIADTFNNKVKTYNPDDGSIMTLLDGLHEPAGIAKKGCSLYIADTNDHHIIRFDLQKMRQEIVL